MEPLECVHLVQQDGLVQIVINVQMDSMENYVRLVMHVAQMDTVMTVHMDQENVSVIQDSMAHLVMLVIAVKENVLMELMETAHVFVLVLLLEQNVINVSMDFLENQIAKFVIVKILKFVIKEDQVMDFANVQQANLEIIVIFVQLVIMEHVMKEN